MYVEKGGLLERVGGGRVSSTLRVQGFRVNHFFPPNRQFGYRKSGVPMAMYNVASKKKQEEGGTSKVIQSLMREPLSFWGGVFAGFLALDLEQDPLKAWIAERAGEAGLDYLAAKKRLAARQEEE